MARCLAQVITRTMYEKLEALVDEQNAKAPAGMQVCPRATAPGQ
jgi:hypothetical protein